MGTRWSYNSPGKVDGDAGTSSVVAEDKPRPALPDPLPEPGKRSPSEQITNPYANNGNGWENYEEPVVNSIPNRLMSEAMDPLKRLRFRMRLGGTDFPWTIDAHRQQTIGELKEALLRQQFGDIFESRGIKLPYSLKLFGLKTFPKDCERNGDDGSDPVVDALTLEDVGIEIGDFVMFGLKTTSTVQS